MNRLPVAALAALASLVLAPGGSTAASRPPGSSGTVATRSALAQRVLVDSHGRPLDGHGTTIAVVDTGVDPTHPAFRLPTGGSKIVRSLSVVPCIAQQALSSDLSCVTDLSTRTDSDLAAGGHGTFVAGVAVGNTFTLPDGTKVGGEAPGARVVMLSATVALQGIDTAFAWVLANHRHPCGPAVPTSVCPPIRVLSLSWGANDPIIAGLEDQLVRAGVTVVWANGNTGGDGSSNHSNPDPSADSTPGILTVASYDDHGTGTRNGSVSPDSSRGAAADPITWPDLSAPGVNIVSACRLTSAICDAVGSDPRNGPGPSDVDTYFVGSGTSWAAPAVAGVIALLLQADPHATPARLDHVLKATAHRFRDGAAYHDVHGLPSSYDKGAGLVDAFAGALRLGARFRSIPSGG